MLRKSIIASCLIVIAALIVGCSSSTSTTTTSTTSTTGSGSFTLISSAFTDGSAIPAVYAKNGEYAGLDSLGAQNTSVPLSWGNPPSGTIYYHIKMIDVNNGSAHWLVINIGSSNTSLSAGASPITSIGYECVNDYTSGRYEGMWPPQGSTHTYRFTIYATTDPADSSGVNNQSTFDAAVTAANVLGSTTLDGTFSW